MSVQKFFPFFSMLVAREGSVPIPRASIIRLFVNASPAWQLMHFDRNNRRPSLPFGDHA